MSTSSIKRQIKRFHVARAVEVKKNCIKKRDARAELSVLIIKPIFLTLLSSSSS